MRRTRMIGLGATARGGIPRCLLVACALFAQFASAMPKIEYKFNYKLDKNDNAVLCGSPCVSPQPTGSLTIPHSIDGHKVVGIDEHALDGCDKITRIELPSGLEWLPKYGRWPCHGKLFVPCRALLQIEISNENPRFTSVDGVLYTKNKKSLVAYPKARNDFSIVPGVESIGYNACEGCQFEYVRLPGSITYVGPWSFEGCARLKVVECLKPDRGRYFGICPFRKSANLRRVIFHGDAPGCRGAFFSGTSGEIVVEVEKDSKGWKTKDSTELPERWPPTGRDSRRICHIKSSEQLVDQPHVVVQKDPTVPAEEANGVLEDLQKKLNDNLAELKKLVDKNPACYINPKSTSIINVSKKIATAKDKRYCSCVNVTFVRDMFYCSGCKQVSGMGDRPCCNVSRKQSYYRWLMERKKVDETRQINDRIDELHSENESLEKQIHSIKNPRSRR